MKRLTIAIFLMFSACTTHAQEPSGSPSIAEYLKGYAEVTVPEGTAHGAGIDQTWRWDDGHFLVRILFYQPPEQLPRIGPFAKFRTTMRIEAMKDCSESIKIDGWGSIRLWAIDPVQRDFWRKASGWELSTGDVEIKSIPDGVIEITIQNQVSIAHGKN